MTKEIVEWNESWEKGIWELEELIIAQKRLTAEQLSINQRIKERLEILNEQVELAKEWKIQDLGKLTWELTAFKDTLASLWNQFPKWQEKSWLDKMLWITKKMIKAVKRLVSSMSKKSVLTGTWAINWSYAQNILGAKISEQESDRNF